MSYKFSAFLTLWSRKTQYLTLGPKFYSYLVLPRRICFCFVKSWFLASSPRIDLQIRIFLSKHHFERLLEKLKNLSRPGSAQKLIKKDKRTKKNIKKRRILALTRRILDENPPYFACPNLFTFRRDLEWSQDLGSLKMKV